MKRETKELKPWQGFVTFGIVILFTQFLAFPVQRAIGLWGVFLTEIGLLAIALLANFIFKGNLKKDFSFNKFSPRQFFGGMLIWLSGMWTGMAVSFVTMWLFPGMAERSAGMTRMFTSENFFVAMLIVAISPAICEEMIHRGFIMGSFAGIKNKALVVTMTGIIFGIFHLDPYRFLQTAILGAAFAYILVETKSIFLTMAFHFMNNFYSLVVGFISVKLGTLNEEAIKMTQSMMNGTMVLANCLIYGAIALGAAYGGYMLITKRGKKPHGVRNMIIIIVAAVVMLMSGFFVNVANVMTNMMDKMNENVVASASSIKYDVNGTQQDGVVIEEDGSYSIYLNLDIDKDGAIGVVYVKDENGNIQFNCTGAGLKMESAPIKLKSGKYTMFFYAISTREEWEEYSDFFDITEEMDYEFSDPDDCTVTASYKVVKK